MAGLDALFLAQQLPPPQSERAAVDAALSQESGLQASWLDCAGLEQRLAEAGEAGAPALAVLLPSVESQLAWARRIHAAWPQTYLLLVQPASRLAALHKSLGLAPMLGRHWSLVELDAGSVGAAVRQALQSCRQRRQLRTTLDRANARMAQTRTVASAEYQRLAASEQHLANFLRHSTEAVVGVDAQGRVVCWSEGARALLGPSARAALGEKLLELGPWAHPLRQALEAMGPRQRNRTVEYTELAGDEARTLEAVITAVRGPAGEQLGMSIMLRDVTSRRREHERLRQANTTLQELVSQKSAELERSQLALLQAQKLEAIGKLTGGVAHDFNNVLQIIGSNLQLLQTVVRSEEGASRLLRSALVAVDRGAKLSAQLLAFARKQPLQPLPLNVSRQLSDMQDLLQRALGEDVELQMSLEPRLWTTLVDANQLENVILNLAINARDAMEQGGRLSVTTANEVVDEAQASTVPDLGAGEYVVVAVSDTGHGMSQDVIARAFEPFFTTKREGEGTGLGLSMAYGFAKQSGGHISLDSRVGQGTTVRLYLPRSHETEVTLPRPSSSPVEGGSETILVVEDDLAVQAAVVDMLQALGYKVLRANDAQAGLTIVQSGVHVDLLFTDVVMPGPLRSPELAQQARALLPGLRVLFTSGYTQNTFVQGGRLDPGVELLSKPYRQEDLARKIRQVLARSPQPVAAAIPPPKETRRGALHILLVEDQDDLRETTVQMLQLLDCEVAQAATAEQAEQSLHEGRPDVLFTDLSLPGRSGLELARAACRRYPGLQIVFCSGYRNDHSSDPDLADAHVYQLPKPYGFDELERLLSRLRARQHAPAT
jgi:PAS domain S-box-containing protein